MVEKQIVIRINAGQQTFEKIIAGTFYKKAF